MYTPDQVWADPSGRADYLRLLDKQNVVRGFECQFFHKDGTTIQGDGIQLQQVILNLILNGAAAMRNTASGQKKIIVRTAMPDSRTLKASVTDFGTGIDEHQIERLFEPFYTTKPKGLGMGLSISQTIIKAHGGPWRLGTTGMAARPLPLRCRLTREVRRDRAKTRYIRD